jgi:hypothetical protein
MGSFFQPQKVRQFDMKPRYYSEEKERIDELKRRVGEVEAEEEERSERIRNAFERRRSLRTKTRNKTLSRTRLFVYIAFIILLIVMISNARFLLF